MNKRVTKSQPSLFTPAETFVKKVADNNARWRRKAVITGFWLIAGFFVWSFWSGDYGVPHIVKMELRKKGLEEANRRQYVMLADVTREANLLRTDSAYIEYIARTTYHMARPNETVYRYRGQ